MISILVPVYNFDVLALIQDLSKQLIDHHIDGEILVIDDGSEEPFLHLNNCISSLPNVTYKIAGKNYGRSGIRMLLAQQAAYDWLLFLDSDSKIISNRFLVNYYNELNTVVDVIVGGRIYSHTKPTNCKLVLHWKYGKERERINLKQKKMQPYQSFMSNNFLIKKAVFNALQLDDSLTGYGHEDTWMGIQLETKKTKMHFIHNPVLHIGLEGAEVYMEKAKNAVQNLMHLEKIVGKEILKKHVKLYSAYSRMKKLKMQWMLLAGYPFLQSYITKNLKSCNPSLMLFDIYRLHFLVKNY